MNKPHELRLQRSRPSAARRLAAALGTTVALAASAPGCSGAISGDCSAAFNESVEAGRKLNAALNATSNIITQLADMDTQLRTTCEGMASDLGIPASELAPAGDPNATQTTCARVVQEIRANLAIVRAGSGVAVVPDLAPPVCRVDVQAYAQCAARCDVTYVPGMSTIECTGGEIRGRCAASCTGTCAVEVSGMCSGSCEGTCSGSCTGMCVGQCDGECSARDATGMCTGSCSGTCNGTCSAGCTGSCQGNCVASASASCTGECRGSCSVEFEQPVCTGTVTPPMASADCRAYCDAQVNVRPTCTPGRARLVLVGSVSGEAQAAFTRTATAILNHYGKVLVIGENLRRIALSAEALVNALQGLSPSLGALSASAVTCTADALLRARVVVPKVQVTVMVSVSVAGSIAP